MYRFDLFVNVRFNIILQCYNGLFVLDIPGNYYEMSSFPETKAEKWATKAKANVLIRYNRHQLSRVYPKGSRFESSNYDPLPFWNCGCHMLALNFQTLDRSMQINQGLFAQNGRQVIQ